LEPSLFETLLNVLPSLLPTLPRAVIAATAMRAAIRPYSIAVAPLVSRIILRKFFILVPLLW